MPLVLSLRKGQAVKVGEEIVRVTEIEHENHAQLAAGGTTYQVSAEGFVEILPKVWVSLAQRNTKKAIRLRLNAPKEIKIERLTV